MTYEQQEKWTQKIYELNKSAGFGQYNTPAQRESSMWHARGWVRATADFVDYDDEATYERYKRIMLEM